MRIHLNRAYRGTAMTLTRAVVGGIAGASSNAVFRAATGQPIVPAFIEGFAAGAVTAAARSVLGQSGSTGDGISMALGGVAGLITMTDAENQGILTGLALVVSTYTGRLSTKLNVIDTWNRLATSVTRPTVKGTVNALRCLNQHALLTLNPKVGHNGWAAVVTGACAGLSGALLLAGAPQAAFEMAAFALCLGIRRHDGVRANAEAFQAKVTPEKPYDERADQYSTLRYTTANVGWHISLGMLLESGGHAMAAFPDLSVLGAGLQSVGSWWTIGALCTAPIFIGIAALPLLPRSLGRPGNSAGAAGRISPEQKNL